VFIVLFLIELPCVVKSWGTVIIMNRMHEHQFRVGKQCVVRKFYKDRISMSIVIIECDYSNCIF
jgi:hypothetical protein